MTGRAAASVAVVLATMIVTMLGGCGQAAKDPSASTKAAAQAPPPAWDIFARARAAAHIAVSTHPIGSSPP